MTPHFCGRCGAAVARPDQRHCLGCGAPLYDGIPLTRDAPTASAQPAASIRPWEIALLGAGGVAWVLYAAWQASPTAAAFARGEPMSVPRLGAIVAIVLLPPIALLAFFAGRLAERGGWRWAAPIFIAVPLIALAMPALPDPPPPPPPTATPTPQSVGLPALPVPIPIPTGLPIPIPTALPIVIPTELPIPLPNRSATPVPGARLNQEDVRRLVKDSLGRCFVLHREVDLSRTTFDRGTWTVALAFGGASWAVDDASGAVTPNAEASARQSRSCRPA